jgi:hypothetical protein
MAISLVGSYASTHAVASAQTIAFTNLRDAANAQPTLLQGDVVVVVYVHAMATTANRTLAQCTPSGYTNAHASAITANDSNAVSMAVSYKVMGASPDANVAIPAAAATTNGVAYAIYVFRGVDTASPLSTTTTVASATNTGVANAPAITPAHAGSWIMVCGGAAVAAGAVFTNPAGLSATTNHFRSATITSTTNDATVGVGLKTDWSSGAFDPAAFGGSTSTNTGSWGAATLALRQFVQTTTHQGSAAVSGAGTLTAVGKRVHNAAVALSGAGTTSFAARIIYGARAALSGAGNQVANAVKSAAARAAAAGSGLLAAIGRKVTGGASIQQGSGTAIVQARVSGAGSASLAGSGSVTAAGSVEGQITPCRPLTRINSGIGCGL